MCGLARDRTTAYFAGDTAYTLTALALAGAFYFFNDFPIRLKRHPIPGTIALQKVALMSYSAGNNHQ